MESVAIIGGGIGGLVAAHMLRQKYKISLFEKSKRLGGNALTVVDDNGKKHDIAVGVFMRSGYPLFFKILDHFNIPTKVIPGLHLTFNNLSSGEKIFLTSTWDGLKAQRFRVLKPDYILALIGLTRKVKSALRYFNETNDQWTLFNDFCLDVLALNPLQYDILLNVLCLLTSMTAGQIEEGPAHFFFRKINKYEMIAISSLYSLRIVSGRTERYISALSQPITQQILLGTNVVGIRRTDDHIYVDTDDGLSRAFNKVVFACNADQALRLIDNPTADEMKILGAWRYNNGEVVLHSDHSVIPEGSLKGLFNFTYLKDSLGKINSSVSGFVSPRLIATQNPNFPIRSECLVHRTNLRTPIFDSGSIPTIAQLPSLNGVLNSYFCGSHFGFGLHEDAIASAVEVCRMLGVEFDDVFGSNSVGEDMLYG